MTPNGGAGNSFSGPGSHALSSTGAYESLAKQYVGELISKVEFPMQES